MTSQLFQTIHLTGFGIYSSVVVFFTVYITFCRLSKSRTPLTAVRRYQWFGAILGLSMGAIVFGGAGLHYGAAGGFGFPDTLASSQLPTKYGIFAVLWVSSFHLEIWTLQGVRSIDPTSELQVSEVSQDYNQAASRVSNQLIFNSALLIAIAYLSCVG